MNNQSLNTPFAWLTGLVAALVIAAAGVSMDGPGEVEAAQDVADYAAAVADGGVSLCKEFGRVPTWTKSGDLVCRAAAASLGVK